MRCLKTTIVIVSVLAAQQARADVFDHFNSALAGLPVNVFQQGNPGSFVNLHAISTIFGELNVQQSMMQRGALAADLPVVHAAVTTSPDEFASQTSIQPYELEFVASYGNGADQGIIWGVEKDAFPTLVSKLPQHGFTPFQAVPGALSNGVIGQQNVSDQNPANPWFSATGEPSLLKATPTLLYQTWREVPLQTAQQPSSAYDAPAGQALSEVYGHGPDMVAQALFFSHGFGSNTELAAAFKDQPYIGAMLADIQGDSSAKASLALVFENCAQVVQLVDAAAGHLDVELPAAPTFTTVETSNACIAKIEVSDPAGSLEKNQAFDAMHRAASTLTQ